MGRLNRFFAIFFIIRKTSWKKNDDKWIRERAECKASLKTFATLATRYFCSSARRFEYVNFDGFCAFTCVCVFYQQSTSLKILQFLTSCRFWRIYQPANTTRFNEMPEKRGKITTANHRKLLWSLRRVRIWTQSNFHCGPDSDCNDERNFTRSKAVKLCVCVCMWFGCAVC